MTEVEEGKYIYGIVTVGRRGQIVIPKEARDQFNIKPGDKLVVAGDIKKGIAIVKADVMEELALKILGAVSEEDRETAKKELKRKIHSDE
ncbi:AbrB/MazE/SpoVT family DNA-binding domain-containing protein [Candidatus Bathyarchaeota archaeon]|nr:MAG: AbrB/MazE/SpoVT family DNA-binding domain-containing protein [Candidatus Bathyarchaeota archaeon]